MTRTRRLASPAKGVLGLHIGIRVGTELSYADVTRLEAALSILRKRFPASITLGLEGLEPLGCEVLSKWLAAGVIDQSISSGHENLIINDLLDAAIRSAAASSIFVDASDLLQFPARWLKFMVEQHGVESGATLDARTGFLRVAQRELLRIPRRRLAGTWRDGLRLVHDGVEAGGRAEIRAHAAAGDIELNLAPRHLFVTKAGVERLGGKDRYRALPIRLGGVSPSEFERATVLVLDDTASGYNEAVPGAWTEVVALRPSVAEDESVVFDIWPAPFGFRRSNSEADSLSINVPRQILVGRRCPVPHRLLAAQTSASREAVFIMSNYNKGQYVHAALYGWVMQAYRAVRLQIVDDISTDESTAKIRAFRRLMGLDPTLLELRVNESKRGTYWIRNLIISRHLRDDVMFLINDSDDVSSALRAMLQLGSLVEGGAREACLFNIVRVDKNYSPLPLNGEVERYGTASLCFKSALIEKIGYFQNIKKNADTEFIRRVKRFAGNAALEWLKLPVMFQCFDGANLTADIYQMKQNGNGITANLDLRKLHLEIAERHHATLTLEDLPRSFGFPNVTLPQEYAQLGNDFLITDDPAVAAESSRRAAAEISLEDQR